MARRIGILTYFWRDNPGTFLQAWAMLSALSARFPEDQVELIDFRVERVGFRLGRSLRVFLGQIGRRRRFARHRRSLLRMSRSALVSRDPAEAAAWIQTLGYDAIIVGSDTVLERRGAYAKYWGDRLPVYWLPPEVTAVKVACAASSGTETGEGLDERLREAMARSIRAFALVGVRDDITCSLMERLGLRGDPRLERVPDPTWALEFDPGPGDAVARRLGLTDGAPVMGVNLPPHPLFDEVIARWRAKGYRVFSFVVRRGVDRVLRAVSPIEWAGLHRHLDLVLTDRFHGSIFSLRAGVPVVAIDCKRSRFTEGGLSKTYSLMKDLGLEKTNHINLELSGTDNAADLSAFIERAVEAFDASAVRRRAGEMAQRFRGFLDRVAGVLDAGWVAAGPCTATQGNLAPHSSGACKVEKA